MVLLDVCLSALSATGSTHAIHSDLAEEVFQSAQKAYAFLFLSCNIPCTARHMAIAKVSTALAEYTTFAGLYDVAESYWTKLILYRLENGPDPAWDKLDEGLAASLRSSSLTPRDLVTLSMVIKEMRQEQWGDEGHALRVSGMAIVIVVSAIRWSFTTYCTEIVRSVSWVVCAIA